MVRPGDAPLRIGTLERVVSDWNRNWKQRRHDTLDGQPWSLIFFCVEGSLFLLERNRCSDCLCSQWLYVVEACELMRNIFVITVCECTLWAVIECKVLISKCSKRKNFKISGFNNYASFMVCCVYVLCYLLDLFSV